MGLIGRWVGREQGRAGPERRAAPAQEAVLASFNLAAEAAGLSGPGVEGSLALPAVYACVRVLAETVASLPLLTYRERGDGSRERAKGHPLYTLLRYDPNPEMTAFEMEELETQHVAAWGNSFSEIEMTSAGRVTALWPLRPDKMEVWRNAAGALLYVYTLPDGRRKTFQAYQIHHRRGLSSNGIVGYSPVRTAMVAVALGLATEEFGARFFANGARPGAVLTHPGTLSAKALANLKESWKDAHEGLSQAHRLRILEEGMKLEAVGVPPEEAQFLETRKFQAEEIARLFRMPPHKIGLMDRATFSNIEHQGIEFVTDTIRPWLTRFEQALRRDLLGPTEAKSLYFEYLVDSLLRGDTASRYGAYATARQWGWMSVNEIRERENMQRIEEGDEYLQPLNMAPLGSDNSEEPTNSEQQPATGEEGRAGWLGPVVEDVARRMARREANDLRREGVKAAARGEFAAWAGVFYDELAAATAAALGPAAEAARRADGRERRAAVEGLAWAQYAEARAQAALVAAEAEDAPAALAELAALVEAGRAEQLARVLGEVM